MLWKITYYEQRILGLQSVEKGPDRENKYKRWHLQFKISGKSIGRDTFRSANRLEETFLEFFQNVFIFPPSPILSSLFCFVFVI